MESSLLMLTHISALWLDSFIMLMFPVCIMQLCWIHFFSLLNVRILSPSPSVPFIHT